MTELEQQIFNDLSTAGWDIFKGFEAKKEAAKHLVRLGYHKYDEEALIDKIASYLEQEDKWYDLKNSWVIGGKSHELRCLLRESLQKGK